jgi:hypothetical protein
LDSSRLILDKPRWPGVVMAAFVLTYLAYFSQQSALIVRNLLIVVPLLCLAAARGIAFVAEQLNLKMPKWSYALYAGIAVILAINMGWEVYAAHQVKRREHFDYFAAKFEDYVKNSPAKRIWYQRRFRMFCATFLRRHCLRIS